MISHEYRCIFIHIPKCAGTSIEHALGHHEYHKGRGTQDHRPISRLQPVNGFSGFVAGGLNLKYRRRILSRKLGYRNRGNPKNSLRVTSCQFRDYFKFTFVRNPWDRCYSWYRNVIRDPVHRGKLGIAQDIRFDEMLYEFANRGPLQPQLHWITDANGKMAMDFVGRFENLEEDFGRVCDKIGLNDTELPHVLNGGPSDYRQAYDDRLKDFVAKTYAEEIALFGYEF